MNGALRVKIIEENGDLMTYFVLDHFQVKSNQTKYLFILQVYIGAIYSTLYLHVKNSL